MKRICRIIFDDPERDTRVVAHADRYAAAYHSFACSTIRFMDSAFRAAWPRWQLLKYT